MSDRAGRIVEAQMGRDKGKLFYVVGEAQGKPRLLLADGQGRKFAHPKEKALGHVTILTDAQREFPHPVTEKLQRGETVSNRELRRALAAFKEEMRLGKR